MRRDGPEWLAWSRDHVAAPVRRSRGRRLSLFVDGPLVEVHVDPDDRWVTAALPSGGVPFRVRI